MQDNHTHFDFIDRYIHALPGRRATLFFFQLGHEVEIQIYLEQLLSEVLDISGLSGAKYLQNKVSSMLFTCTGLHDL